jgi:hypothetical protein
MADGQVVERDADLRLAQLGAIAGDAVWKTPMYRIFGEHEDRRAELNHKNDILVGRALVDRLTSAGLMVVTFREAVNG